MATRQLSLHSQQRLEHITPVLFGFLRPHLPQQHCDASVCNLVAQLLKVGQERLVLHFSYCDADYC